ncbi:MAG: sensor histidine kinase, partial [Oscillospiraceae bacterium]|nr:sensor histidine kinase [Oscillospiraceae bacterium]
SRKRQIIFQSDSHKYMIRSNQEMLLRIFDNLINNAFKHGTGDLTVTVSAGETVTLTFTNQMTGSSPDIEQIFDEFYTTDISRTKGNTGLGLAIAKQFTQMLGGSISAAEENRNFIITVQFFHPA